MKKQSKTVIAVVRTKRGKLLMAGDRRVSYEDGTIYNCPYPKIRRLHNGILIGASGDSGLCKLCVDGLVTYEFPELETDHDTYMYYTFIPALVKLIKQQPGYQDQHKILRIATTELCSLLVALKGRLYTVDIMNPEDGAVDATLSRIILDDAPVPFAIGCGGSVAMTILNDKLEAMKYNTRDDLVNAVKAACNQHSGCGLIQGSEPDVISE
jgi:hypothetical protein